MRVLIAVSAILLASFCTAEQAEEQAVQAIAARLKTPSACVRKLAQPLKLDAAPDFAAWTGPLAFGTLSGTGQIPPAVQTEGYLAFGNDSLYLAIRCVEPEMQAVKSAAVALDGDVWQSDNVEFMVLPGLDVTAPYYQFAVNPAGSLYDAKINDKTWNSGAEVKAFKDDKSWTVVLAVPFAVLGVKAGDVPPLWRVNLHRARPKRGGGGDLDLSWSPTHSRSNHVPSRFALAYLQGRPLDVNAVNASLDEMQKLQILYRATFDKDTGGLSDGEIVRKPEGNFLRVAGKRQISLERNFGDIKGLRMALAYRTAPDVAGLVVQGSGTIVRACRPGLVEVLGRGLKVAQETCQDADGQSSASDLGMDAFLFKRPYGH